MPDIKIRDIAKGTVKALDKSATAAERMKNAYIRTKEKAEQSASSGEDSPDEYAAERVSVGTETVIYESAHHLDKFGRKSVKTTKENFSKAKDYFQKQVTDQPKKQVQRKAAESIRRTAGNTSKSIKIVDRGGKTIKQTAKSTAKGTVKTAQKTVKTAESTAKAAIKTTQQAAKTAQKTAQATAKAARAASQAARAAAKAAIVTAKAVARAIALAVKAAIAGTKALIAAIAAGGWVAVVIILVICVVAMIVGSCFGIFFSGESAGNSDMTIQSVVQEINTEYTAKLDEIKLQNPHDMLEISGVQADWPDILAVYAVKTSNTQEVASIDDNKKAILKSVFWDTNAISHHTESREVTEITVTVDRDGKPVETSHTVTKTVLLITVSHKSVDELAAQYGFSEAQKQQLAELLSPKNESMWSAVLTGTISQHD